MANQRLENVSVREEEFDRDNIPIAQLYFDPDNPRLVTTERLTNSEDILRILWTEMSVDEVAFSIAENGYYKEEPLLVVCQNPKEENKDKRKYTVIEGNRRLAAVLLLRDKELRTKLKATDLPEISEKRREELHKLPVLIYKKKESIWAYLGFRHVNGPKPWDAYSKAQYIAEVKEKYKVSLEDIAKKIGDRHATVSRLYRGYKVLQQAEAQAGFDKEDRVRNRFYFSHLYTALDQPEFQKFLGISSEGSLESNSIPKSRLPQLGDLMVWLYGRKSTNTQPLIRSQYPDLHYLREAISKPHSLSALRSGYSLDTAYAISLGDKRRFRDALASAKEQLQQAKATVTTGYDGAQDSLGLISDIQKLVASLHEEMSSIITKKG